MADGEESSPTTTRRRLGELLLDAELLSEAQLQSALQERAVVDGRRERLGETVVRLGFASEADIGRALAKQLGLQYLEWGEVLVADEQILQLVPAALAERHAVIPLRLEADGTLVVACADPTNFVAVEDVRLASNAKRVRRAVAAAGAVNSAIEKAYNFDQAAGELLESMGDRGDDEADELAASDAPVIRLAEGIIAQAVDARASDIHVEPGLGETVVRYRVDGVLKQVMTVPRNATGPLVSRLKLMSGMDIAERRRPQDGRTRFRGAKGLEVDLRVSSLPSMHGETIVVRLLRKGAEQLAIKDVGFTDEQYAQVMSIIERPQGLVLVTGPTGSGKTSTLYSFLAHVANESNNIITIEDPIEFELGGINQTQVNDRVGLTFARALRTVLRQDPDVVMVGEIRDPETAELAMQASLTGHLVFSTLHTNDAPGAVIRLRDLGIPPYLIASSLSMVVGQRLVRTICPRCSAPAVPSERQVAQLHLAPRDLDTATFRAGGGCATCGHTGYKNRQGLFEVLAVDGTLRELIANQAAEPSLRQAARVAGMRSLREDGLARAMRGTTTLEEILRVSPTDNTDEGACPVCAQTVEPDFSLCPWCGANLRAGACAGCERELEHGWRVCPDCGAPTGFSEDAADARQRKVLVVDDDESVRDAIAAMLHGDYEVLQAKDGLSAMDSIHKERPDAVLLDVGLPDKDGYTVTRELRSRAATM
ncbi:MAG TPA: ATPase, T2SS/T4P/T4SS family, partial [Egibacteraceae bacterium]|nr:ATPase, T2SS/T4P/T4SS family [Egibacteraceae bacterium]